MRLILVKIDTREMSQPTRAIFLEEVRKQITPALHESLGKDVTIIVTNLDLEFISKENLENYVRDLNTIVDKMK